MAAPGLVRGVVFDVLIDKTVVPLLEMRPPTVTHLNLELAQHFLNAVDADTCGIVGQVQHLCWR